MAADALTLERVHAMDPGEAAALFVTRRAEGLTPTEQDLLADWLAANEEHRRAYESADRAWDSFTDADDDELLSAMRAHARRSRPPARRGMDWRPLAAAAAVVVVIAGAGLVLIPNREAQVPSPPQPGGPEAVAGVRYASARGEVKTVPLPDGSVMTLDAESTAVVRYSASARSIELLRGRAFFDVRQDSKPFEVAAADRRVVAIGTRFEVELGARALTVTLVQGRLLVRSLTRDMEPVTLEAGQRFVERDGAHQISTVPAGTDGAAGWREGLLNFDDVTLAEAVAEVNRYSSDQIVIRDPRVASMRISGQFRAGEAERFARTVAEIQPVRAVRGPNGIELTPAG